MAKRERDTCPHDQLGRAIAAARQGTPTYAQRILLNVHKVGLDGEPFAYKPKKQQRSPEEQLRLVRRGSSSLLGVKTGAFLRGTGKKNKDVVIQYLGPPIPPTDEVYRITSDQARLELQRRTKEVSSSGGGGEEKRG